MALLPGRRLGTFEIVCLLGAGGMGEAYRARDTKLGREVALKLLREPLARDPERVARLEREAHLLASLNHANIATLHGLEESSGVHFLVMELVPGPTLAEHLAAGSLRVRECLGIFRQIAEALEAAHDRGVIHRDLKPSNIKVTPEGVVKVLDFGLAKALQEEPPAGDLSEDPTATREGTRAGVVLGTAAYMSPEQARGKAVDRRTDIWSFGCVFYETLTRRKAFAGDTVSDTIASILEKEADWQALPESTPPKIRDLLKRCLQKDPHRRLKDIGDARIEIEEAIAEPAAAALPGARPTSRRLVGWTLAGMAALATAVAIWSLSRTAPLPSHASRFVIEPPSDARLVIRNDPAVAISPDGTRLAYVGGEGERNRLYLRELDRLDVTPIPGTDDAGTVSFSPDGRWVVFYGLAGKLIKVALDGGPPAVLCEAPDGWGVSWGHNDTILFAALTNSGLSSVSAAGGPPRVLTRPDRERGETSHLWPEILPGGRAAVFTVLTKGEPRIALVSLETGEQRILVEGATFPRYSATGHLLYVRDRTLVAAPFDLKRLDLTGPPVAVVDSIRMSGTVSGTAAHFSIARNGTLVYVPGGPPPERRLVWVDRTGAAQPITETRRAYGYASLSPDGNRLAVTIAGDVWLYEFARDTLTRLTFNPRPDAYPIWTPDGQRVTFRSGPEIFWKRADGSGAEERLIEGGTRHDDPVSWSPDGKVLAFNAEGESWDIWILPLEDRRTFRPIVQTPAQEYGGSFSPDGRWLAYVSLETGRSEVYVQAFPGPSGKWQVSDEGGVQPVWARSGREIFYRSGDKMMAVAVETGPAFLPSRPKVLFQGNYHGLPGYTGYVGNAPYDVALDGRFVMIEPDPRESEPAQINVVLNWFEELKRRAPTPN